MVSSSVVKLYGQICDYRQMNVICGHIYK